MLNNNNSTGASAKGPNNVLVASHVLIALLSPVAIVGNAVVLVAIWKRSFQRTPFHILLSVLAFSDLCTGFATSVMSIPYLYNHKLYTTESAIGILSGTYLVSLTILVITLMSIERWLHMTRRSLITSRRGCLIAAVSLVVPIPFVVLQAVYFFKDSFKLEVGTAMGVYLLSCYLATSVAYLKCSVKLADTSNGFVETSRVKVLVNERLTWRNTRNPYFQLYTFLFCFLFLSCL